MCAACAGVVAITFAGSVPLNNESATYVDLDAATAAVARSDFKSTWNRLNVLRSILAICGLIAIGWLHPSGMDVTTLRLGNHQVGAAVPRGSGGDGQVPTKGRTAVTRPKSDSTEPRYFGSTLIAAGENVAGDRRATRPAAKKPVA
jgi:hypothetical protein